RKAVAKRRVAAAGYPKGVDVELVLRRGPMYEPGALSRQDDLKKVGIQIKITLLDTAGFRDRIDKGDFQAYTALLGVPFDDPDLYYARLVCQAPFNLGHYCNPAFDTLFAQPCQTFEPPQRAAYPLQRGPTL